MNKRVSQFPVWSWLKVDFYIKWRFSWIKIALKLIYRYLPNCTTLNDNKLQSMYQPNPLFLEVSTNTAFVRTTSWPGSGFFWYWRHLSMKEHWTHSKKLKIFRKIGPCGLQHWWASRTFVLTNKNIGVTHSLQVVFCFKFGSFHMKTGGFHEILIFRHPSRSWS